MLSAFRRIEPDRTLHCRQVHLRAPVPKAVLLYGPIGSGKSLLTQAIVSETGSAFFNLTPTNTDGKPIL
jgi:SpoVK/Ycf46/Vps4 family AAA+-type ATPase